MRVTGGVRPVCGRLVDCKWQGGGGLCGGAVTLCMAGRYSLSATGLGVWVAMAVAEAVAEACKYVMLAPRPAPTLPLLSYLRPLLA